MKIKALHQYSRDVDTVFGLFHDPAFMKTKYEGIGARNVQVPECSGSDGRYTVKIKREVPADWRSAFKGGASSSHHTSPSSTTAAAMRTSVRSRGASRAHWACKAAPVFMARSPRRAAPARLLHWWR